MTLSILAVTWADLWFQNDELTPKGALFTPKVSSYMNTKDEEKTNLQKISNDRRRKKKEFVENPGLVTTLFLKPPIKSNIFLS